MVSVVIFAGGTGVRLKSADKPKQFLEVDGKPIIIRTLEKFAYHPEVDAIVVACLADWIPYLNELIAKFNLPKITAVVPGGKNGFESIHNGLVKAAEPMNDDDVVLISDGVRPILTNELISDCIATAREFGTAVPCVPSIDSVLQSPDGKTCKIAMPRNEMFVTQAPQGYRLSRILWAHGEVKRLGLPAPVSSSELFISLGEEIRLVPGDQDNIKVTTDYDLHVLKSRYEYKKRHEAELADSENAASHGL